MPRFERDDSRVPLALNLELSHGRHGASARVEVCRLSGGGVARLALRGWIETIAMRRLAATLDDLASRGFDASSSTARSSITSSSVLCRSCMPRSPISRERRAPYRMSGLSQHLAEQFAFAAVRAGIAGGPCARRARWPHEWNGERAS